MSSGRVNYKIPLPFSIETSHIQNLELNDQLPITDPKRDRLSFLDKQKDFTGGNAQEKLERWRYRNQKEWDEEIIGQLPCSRVLQSLVQVTIKSFHFRSRPGGFHLISCQDTKHGLGRVELRKLVKLSGGYWSTIDPPHTQARWDCEGRALLLLDAIRTSCPGFTVSSFSHVVWNCPPPSQKKG